MWDKLLVAFIAFAFGLLAEVIKRAFQKERIRVSYTTASRPVIAVSESLPESVRAALPELPQNITEFVVDATCDGQLPAENANLLIELPAGTEILSANITTHPQKEVPYSPIERPSEVEVRVPGITLERNERITVSVFAQCNATAQLNTYWSGAGAKAEWKETSGRASSAIARHVEGIIFNYILAEIAQAAVAGLFFFIASLLEPVMDRQFDMYNFRQTGMAAGMLIASLVKLYFLMRIVPHAISLVEIYRERRTAG